MLPETAAAVWLCTGAADHGNGSSLGRGSALASALRATVAGHFGQREPIQSGLAAASMAPINSPSSKPTKAPAAAVLNERIQWKRSSAGS